MDKKIKANILTKLGEWKQNMTSMNKNLKREIIPAKKKKNSKKGPSGNCRPGKEWEKKETIKLNQETKRWERESEREHVQEQEEKEKTLGNKNKNNKQNLRNQLEMSDVQILV